MSDHSHSSRLYGRVRDPLEKINQRDKVKRLREKDIEEIKGMFAQLIKNQERAKKKHSERSSKRR